MPLREALEYVIGTGVSDEDAREQICNAITDELIDVRITHGSGKTQILDGGRRWGPLEFTWSHSAIEHHGHPGEPAFAVFVELNGNQLLAVFGAANPRAVDSDEVLLRLTEILKARGDMKTEAALRALQEALPGATREQFREAWPKARIAAELPARRPGGRPKR
jgi:hypothetical protein